jgi:hypothetical protein
MLQGYGGIRLDRSKQNSGRHQTTQELLDDFMCSVTRLQLCLRTLVVRQTPQVLLAQKKAHVELSQKLPQN